MWWKTGVVYQIYPRSFMDSNGDGIGDIPGIISRLDYLQWLGIDAIWFSPLFPSPMADFGYDVMDYTDIHHEYGSLADFDKLLIEAHSRNIKIILDLVPNHTSIEHPWFQESRSSRDNPKRDWYIWKDPKPDGSPPNNWLAYFGGPAWTFDETTGQYYMHNFDPGQPELNWRNPEVKQAMFDVIRFWLRRGVDGFRIDVIDRILKDTQFRDNPPNPDWKPGDPLVGSLLRVYSEAAPGTHDYMRQFHRVFDEFPGTVAIGEVQYGLTTQQLAAFYGDDDELHLPFNFGLLGLPWDAAAIRAFVDDYDAGLPAFGQPNYVLGNHDSPRIASKYGMAQVGVAAVLLLTLRGTPTIYYGEELGMHNVTIPADQILDPQGKNQAGFNRDECRTPMQWDTTPNAGFTCPDVVPWLPVASDYEQINVAVQQQNPASLLNLYRRLLAYRKRTPALNAGRYYSLDAPEGCFVYLRQFNDQQRLVVLNFTTEAHTLSLDEWESGLIAISTDYHREGQTIDLKNWVVRANEALVIEV
ncbi:MAG: alpha-amylase [Phototrophicales bacterium]|nr:MAG: alpha-amylase [Phototrophicales bacterium]